MQLLTVDIAVRRWLLDRSLPIHFYAEGLFHASTCLRELAKDTLKLVNTANLPTGDLGEADLPDDYSSDVGCFLSAGGRLQSLPHKSNLNPLRIHDATTGQFVAQPTTDNSSFDASGIFGSNTGFWFWNVDDYGQSTGRYFGANGGTNYGYQIFKERRQIQMTGGFENSNIIFQYIGNGQSVDNATQIDWAVHRCLTTFIDWQRSPNATNKMSPEGNLYYFEKRMLRANLSDLTISDVKDVLRSNYTASVKN